MSKIDTGGNPSFANNPFLQKSRKKRGFGMGSKASADRLDAIPVIPKKQPSKPVKKDPPKPTSLSTASKNPKPSAVGRSSVESIPNSKANDGTSKRGWHKKYASVTAAQYTADQLSSPPQSKAGGHRQRAETSSNIGFKPRKKSFQLNAEKKAVHRFNPSNSAVYKSTNVKDRAAMFGGSKTGGSIASRSAKFGGKKRNSGGKAGGNMNGKLPSINTKMESRNSGHSKKGKKTPRSPAKKRNSGGTQWKQKQYTNPSTNKTYTPKRNSGVKLRMVFASEREMGKENIGSFSNAQINASFGKPIRDLEAVKLPRYGSGVPKVLIVLKKKLHECDGIKQKGIFHPSTKSDGKPHTIISSLLRSWFSELPKPLLSVVEPKVIDQARNLKLIPKVVSQIPEPNQSTLLWLWDLLADVAEHTHVNRMTPQHLAQAFGPSMVTISQRDIKGPRATMAALFASRVIVFFKRGIEWRLSIRN